jgi:hypothetical protein
MRKSYTRNPTAAVTAGIAHVPKLRPGDDYCLSLQSGTGKLVGTSSD